MTTNKNPAREIWVKDDKGKKYSIPADPGEEETACRRIADLHRVRVVAWRDIPYGIYVGSP